MDIRCPAVGAGSRAGAVKRFAAEQCAVICGTASSPLTINRLFNRPVVASLNFGGSTQPGRGACDLGVRIGAGDPRNRGATEQEDGCRSSMPVLVVDDYNTMIRIIRNLLRQIGFADIDDAADGIDRARQDADKRYGLVISDWNMEPMTRLRAAQGGARRSRLGETPFIMVTAESKTENVIAAKKAGVNNYIVKPFNAQTLKSQDRGGVR